MPTVTRRSANKLASTVELFSTVDAESVVFATLPDLGFATMTPGGVEHVICASALTAQM